MAAASTKGQKSAVLENAIQISMDTTNRPATGVQRPASRDNPAHAAIIGGTARERPLTAVNALNDLEMRNVETASRRINKPLPGEPFAKVEYNRCRTNPVSRILGQ